MDPIHAVMEYAKRYDRVCVNQIPANLTKDFYEVWLRNGHLEFYSIIMGDDGDLNFTMEDVL